MSDTVDDILKSIDENWRKADSLPSTRTDTAPVVAPAAEEQAKALTSISKSLSQLTNFITTGGLTELLAAQATHNAISGVMQGLAAHDGRQALDARVMAQNGLEIAKHIDAAVETALRLKKEKEKGDHDPEIHDAEADFKKFKEK